MTVEEATAYIENCGWSSTRLGLGRTRELLRRLGDPQKRLRFIHVAGSNGKGSTCALLYSILRAAGYRTGLYTSPHLVRFNERMCVDGAEISDDELAELTGIVAGAADTMEDHPSQFELSTAIAFLYFLKKDCDIVVLEVGMGGELDSTNVIDAPLVAVITNIGLDHTEYLGDTVEEIARTKGGIIKTGSYAVCYDLVPEAYRVIEGICLEKGVPLRKADFSCLECLEASLYCQRISYRGREYELSLPGSCQMYNAAVALEAVEALNERGAGTDFFMSGKTPRAKDFGVSGWTAAVSQDAVRKGLKSAVWGARFEVLSREPLVILDGGHNPQCAAALVESARVLMPGRRVIFLTGMLRDKDYNEVIDILGDIAERFVCVTPESGRALCGSELAEAVRKRWPGPGSAAMEPHPEEYTASAYDSYEDALIAAFYAAYEGSLPVVIFGSLYLAGAMKALFPSALRKWIRRLKRREREMLDPAERESFSGAICRSITESDVYRNARTVMLYKCVRGEVSLKVLEERAAADGKRLCYPVVLGDGIMAAVEADPKESAAWRKGAYGIEEPLPVKVMRADGPDKCSAAGSGGNIDSELSIDIINAVPEEDIDLVVCPLAAFDDKCSRLGMGGGYYDRFLPGCVNAYLIGAAFSVQRFSGIPAEAHDVRMDRIITEAGSFSSGV